MELSKTVQEIQYMLAPAIMISSSALLLLGFQNKFSSLFNRFRALNQEKRSLDQKPSRNEVENKRLENLREQLARIFGRASYVKNAIFATYTAIVCFIATSIFLFLNIYSPLKLPYLTICFFLLGLILILASSFFMLIETRISFRILLLERKI
ncbi:MAG: DUF2721 domain-containing protein [Candidatus Omnitrophica bacterium]|nr:DUF2721 domain-containing protein [Candidatus Omnitrophota bacterium]